MLPKDSACRSHRRPATWPLFLLVSCLWLFAGRAEAAPQAHILRIDPRASQAGGNPVLTTLVEVVQSERVSSAIAPCAMLSGNSQFSCMSDALEKPYALYKPFPFPENNALFTVMVEGSERPATHVSHAKWGDSLAQPGVGTAWLILVDADKRMGRSLDDARQVARQFVASMGQNDIVNVMFFNDRQVVQDSKWVGAAAKNKVLAFVDGVTANYPSQGRTRSLLSIIKQAATDGFGGLGNVGESLAVPLHQAMVVLSNGYGGADAATSGPGAMQLQNYMTQGRFPENNTAAPKVPVPVISVLFPYRSIDEFRQNSLEFMQNLSNPEIGGFFTVVQEGQGARASAVVNAVRSRFAKMYIVKWKVSCLAPTVTQTFALNFADVKPPILGDSTFKDVPIGIDPTSWPLDVNVQYTKDAASRQNGVYAGGKFKVFGDFCWGGDQSRAEVYFLPAGQAVPKELTGTNLEAAKRAQQQLIQNGMKGTTLGTSDTFAEFQAPDKDKLLQGSGKSALVRLVLYDNKARRVSGVTADTILELQGTEPPFPLLYALGGAFALVVILLLVIVIARGGNKNRPAGPPGPGQGPGYGGPPGGGYGGPPPQGGYGAPPGYSGGQPPPGQGPGYRAAPLQQQILDTSRAILEGAPGVFTVLPGAEIHVGSDRQRCNIVLDQSQALALQASLKLEAGMLYVRNEQREGGTHVNGHAAPLGAWMPVVNESLLRIGRAEFGVSLH